MEKAVTGSEVTSVNVDLLEGMRFSAMGEDSVEVSIDSDSAHGGSGVGLRPMELLLVSLGSCTGMDVLSILRKKRQHVTGYRIEVAGTRAPDPPHVFTSITLRHIVRGSDIDDRAVQRAIELSETKYCPAYAMLAESAPISTSYEVHPIAPAD